MLSETNSWYAFPTAQKHRGNLAVRGGSCPCPPLCCSYKLPGWLRAAARVQNGLSLHCNFLGELFP